MDDYSQFPKSLTETRSEKSGNAADWTVRDMLIALLRDIDSGEIKPRKAVMIYTLSDGDDGKEATVKKTQVIDSYIEGHGLLSIGLQMDW